MLKNLLWKSALVVIAPIATQIGTGASTASTTPCEGKGGAIFAQASGVGEELSVEVACADGTWELY